MSQVLIGLCGPMRAGKDTIGRVMVESHGFVRYAFADAVKESVIALDPIVGMHMVESDDPELGHELRVVRLHDLMQGAGLEGMEEAKAYPEVRRLLQRMGTEVGREVISPSLWTDIVMERSHHEERVVITDVRFINEADRIWNEGGYVVRVRRSGTGGGSHASESELEDIMADYEFDNDIPLDEVPSAVEQMLKELRTL